MSSAVALVPGVSLGPFGLGASLHECASIVKESSKDYPAIHLHYAQSLPLVAPVVVTLPENGIRLRFDGPDQRLRLIEVVDFDKIKLTYKGNDLVKARESGASGASRPAFKRIYQIFEASYPGIYVPPPRGVATGTYALSWTGIAFTFQVQHAAWAPNKDHITLLGSQATSSAIHMAVFEGSSWPEVQNELFVREPTGSRLSAIVKRPKDNLPAEIEIANIQPAGTIELIRRVPALPFYIILNQTTPQDLITELGPPDTTYQRDERLNAPDTTTHIRRGSSTRPMPSGRSFPGSPPSSYSSNSTGTDTYDADFDSGDNEDQHESGKERFWCYFSHGMDILVGPPTVDTPANKKDSDFQRSEFGSTPSHNVVTKVVLHGNVPGSYAFNRHRRLRWTLQLASTNDNDEELVNSESTFDQTIKPALMRAFSGTPDMEKGKVINRTWGANPSDSSFFLPDAEEELVEGNTSEQWLGNTRLYSFPGIVVEVLESGWISEMTVY